MKPKDPVLTPEEAISRFSACAICSGYCSDSGRQELAETFERELTAFVYLMAADELGRMERLCQLMAATANPWVRYYAAAFAYLDYGRPDARKVLEELVNTPGGLFNCLAQVALASGA